MTIDMGLGKKTAHIRA